MNIPNLITILRILFIPVFIILILYNHYPWGLAVFSLAVLSDGLDGFIARYFNQRTVLGSYLDPMADKLLLIAGFVTLSFLQIIPVWSTIVVVSRDLILIFGALIFYMIQGHFEIMPSWLGKSTTVLQMGYVFTALFLLVFERGNDVLLPLLIVAMTLTVVSGLHYIYRGVQSLNT